MFWITNSLIIAVGVLLLVKGADWLVDGGVGMAYHFNLTPMFIGLTIVAFGTSSPELAASLTASLHGQGNIVIGNIVGSNICNIGLILGVAAILKPVEIKTQTIKLDIPVMLGASVIFFCIFLLGRFSRLSGMVIIVLFVAFNIYLFRISREPSEEVEKKEATTAKLLGLTTLGLICLGIGAKIFLHGAVSVARALSISNAVIALTLIALGTSLPELFISGIASYKGKHEIVVGNIVGSNISNILLVVGITAVISPFDVSRYFLYGAFPCMIAFSVLFYVIARKYQVISRLSGVFIIACYFAYIYTL